MFLCMRSEGAFPSHQINSSVNVILAFSNPRQDHERRATRKNLKSIGERKGELTMCISSSYIPRKSVFYDVTSILHGPTTQRHINT